MSDTVFIYHANCMDGLAAAAAAHFHRGNEDDDTYLPMTYGQPIPWDRFTNKVVYLLDFSFSATDTRTLLAVASKVIIIDHHKTALKNLEPLLEDGSLVHARAGSEPPTESHLVYDVTHSGAFLSWTYFSKDPSPDLVPHLILYIEDRDLWEFKYEGTREVHAALIFQNPSLERLSCWLDDKVMVETLKEVGSTLVAYNKVIVKNIISSCARMSTDRDGVPVAVCNCPFSFASEVGNKLCEEGLNGEKPAYAVMFCVNKEGDVVVSLRSVGDFDVSVLAAQHGGGGHKNAAGFTFKATEEHPFHEVLSRRC